MGALRLARWQFALTTAFHFIFVPLSIGLALLVAIMHTMYHRTGRDTYRRMTRFWGKLLVINFALGVVTGIVQEFQFGMNWSAYSRYVGDVFGAPLAMEGLLAFFMESTFIGLWLFGWGKLPPRTHVATAWAVSVGTLFSAYFIIAANSWMQHPVGAVVNPATGRAEMKDFFALVSNSTALVAFAHTILAAFLTAGLFVVGVSAYHLMRKRDVDVFLSSAKVALVVACVSALGVAFVGHAQAQLMTTQQPMKMAAAEGLWDTERGASFSLFTVGTADGREPVFQLRLPNLLSVLATNSWNGTVEGMRDLQAGYEQRYGPGSYTPPAWITYWSFRVMVGLGFLLILLTLTGLVLMRRGRLEHSRRFLAIALWAIGLPTVANITGWVFTEVGRQPWVVFGLMKTSDAVSPTIGAGTVAASLIGFTVVYTILAAVDIALMARFAGKGPEPEAVAEAERIPTMAY